MSAEEFHQSITLHPNMLEWHSKDKTPEEIEEIKDFRLAIGFVFGVDIPGGTTKGRWFPYSVGPNGEKAVADRFAVFYKNGTHDFGRPSCAWYNQLPQGFSCGKGSTPISECNRGWERFESVPCNELVLKVAKDEHCETYPEGVYIGAEGNYKKDELDTEDCFAGVNWT